MSSACTAIRSAARWPSTAFAARVEKPRLDAQSSRPLELAVGYDECQRTVRDRRVSEEKGHLCPAPKRTDTVEFTPMNVRPLHDRIIVLRLEEGEQKVGGIIIPDTA